MHTSSRYSAVPGRHLTRLLFGGVGSLLAACADLPAGPEPAGPRDPAAARFEVQCQASARSSTLHCGARPAGAARTDLIIGGQHVYVRLASSNVAYSAVDSIFSADVTVENLMAQVFGTDDGTTDTGLRVFFQSGPSVTAGSGQVTVHNEDGTDVFLAPDQPYFAYPGALPPGATSEGRTWQWKVDAGVESFAFTVLVEGKLQHEQSLLLFRPTLDDEAFYAVGVWGTSASSVFAVGADGTLARLSGGVWAMEPAAVPAVLWDVWGSSASDVFGVGEAGRVMHWDGTSWSEMDSGLACGCESLYGVWGSGSGHVLAVGDGGVITTYDGSSWIAADTMPVAWLGGVWGSGPSDVFAVGDSGAIFHNDGTGWTPMTSGLEGTGEYINTVWGLSATNVYAATSSGVLHYDGVSWSPMSGLPSCEVYSVWGTAPDNLFVSNQCGIMHYDGSTWAFMDPGGFVTDIWGAGPNEIFVNSDGYVYAGTR